MANERNFLAMRVLLALTFAALAGATQASDGRPPEPSSCQFTAFVEETDPAGLNVRAAPSASAKVLGTLPPVWSDRSGLRVRARVSVTASAKGWFKIRDAVDDDMLTGQPPRPTYQGEGWVSGRKLVVKSQANIGRTGPVASAPEAVRLKDDLLFDGDAAIAAGRLVDCRGDWAQVEYEEARFSAGLRSLLITAPAVRADVRKGRFRVWLDRICGIQETSCDGP
ncbi:SH3 domain-containing protein [Roseateles sp. DAIF2]|uniref:SH3 domain-containing protein n=1 Tax=Roseateles sp. DAIF2 TaxID=2714952 RepID=UPI0018A2FE2C|nr:SH3 domain-containing protein [Roseateles sp. DAIF2]QPF74729.1 SH3 domain-containing protein [Roseateles sp. DAIF2]